MTEAHEGAAEAPLTDPGDKTQPAEGGRDEADPGATATGSGTQDPADEAGVTAG